MKTYTVNEYEQEDYSRAREEMTDHEAARILEKIDRVWLPGYDSPGSRGILKIINCMPRWTGRLRH